MQSFKDHADHHVLVDPGNADLTADVDFSLLRKIAEREGIVAHGPMTQNAFLHKMGIRQRVDVSNCGLHATHSCTHMVISNEMWWLLEKPLEGKEFMPSRRGSS